MDEAIEHFRAITNTSPEEGRAYLESSNGDLEIALQAFYGSGASARVDSDDDDDEDVDMDRRNTGHARDNEDEDDSDDEESGAHTAPTSSAFRGSGNTLGGEGSSAQADATASSSSTTAAPAKPRGPGLRQAGTGKIATLWGNSNNDSDDESDKDKKKPTSWFAGGEKSGISVQDPNANKKKEKTPDGPNETVRNLLKKAAEGSKMKTATPAPKASTSGAFGGGGNTLGSEDTPSQPVPSATAEQPTMPSPSQGTGILPSVFRNMFGRRAPPVDPNRELPEDYNEESVTRHLTLWRDGFSVEDGPLMRYDVPSNMQTLQAIQAGTAPENVLNVRYGQQVELRVSQRTGEDYVPGPPKPLKPFKGSGNRLGAPEPAPASPTSASSSQPSILRTGSAVPSAGIGGNASNPPALSSTGTSSSAFEVDNDKPITTLQIRLVDGTRQTARFNHDHTIGDIRRYINASNAGMASRNYALMVPFPRKDLEDENQSIKDAGLLNAVVTQRWT